jgi:hypothetical protein
MAARCVLERGTARLIVCALMVLTGLGPAVAWSQQDSAAAQHAPPSPIDGYAIVASKVFPDSSAGRQFRYAKAGQAVIDVFLFPYPVPAMRLSADPTLAAKTEASNYQASLPVLQQRGYFDSYRVAFTAADTTRFASETLVGTIVAVAVKRHGEIFVSFQYAYGLPGGMLKVRVDVPQAQMGRSDARAFVHDLVAQVAAGPG